jgi:hypothetical protein
LSRRKKGNMTRYNKMQQAREDFAKGLISEEEFRDIMEECDFAEFEVEENEALEIYEDYEVE